MIKDVRQLRPGCLIKTLEKVDYDIARPPYRKTVEKDEYLMFLELEEDTETYALRLRSRHQKMVNRTTLKMKVIQSDKVIKLILNVFDDPQDLPKDLKDSNYIVHWLSEASD